MKQTKPMKVNVMVKGVRERQYVYLEKEDKQYLKSIAKKKHMSVSRLIQEWVKRIILEEDYGEHQEQLF